ncbi:hypothetical protein GUITHDRAFT_155947, partial [Guillardia theta CCMP2712]
MSKQDRDTLRMLKAIGQSDETKWFTCSLLGRRAASPTVTIGSRVTALEHVPSPEGLQRPHSCHADIAAASVSSSKSSTWHGLDDEALRALWWQFLGENIQRRLSRARNLVEKTKTPRQEEILSRTHSSPLLHRFSSRPRDDGFKRCASESIVNPQENDGRREGFLDRYSRNLNLDMQSDHVTLEPRTRFKQKLDRQREEEQLQYRDIISMLVSAQISSRQKSVSKLNLSRKGFEVLPCEVNELLL